MSCPTEAGVERNTARAISTCLLRKSARHKAFVYARRMGHMLHIILRP